MAAHEKRFAFLTAVINHFGCSCKFVTQYLSGSAVFRPPRARPALLVLTGFKELKKLCGAENALPEALTLDEHVLIGVAPKQL